MSQEVSG